LEEGTSPSKPKHKKKKSSEQEKEKDSSADEIVICPSVFDEEDQTFIQNGIVVENKNDLTDHEKQKLR